MGKRKVLILCCLLLFTSFIVCTNKPVSAQSIHRNTAADLNYWNIGKPWQPINFGVNVTDSPVDVLNVTLYYSLNEIVDEPKYHKVLMELDGTPKNGFWSYTLEGQSNGTIIYYSYKVYFTDGNYQGPEPFLWDPYHYEIYIPTPKLELTSFSIRNLDPIALTVDVTCGLTILYYSHQESIPVYVFNKADGFYSAKETINVSQCGRMSTYWFQDVVTIEDLKLTGYSDDIPFDEYFLDIEIQFVDQEIKHSVITKTVHDYTSNYVFDASIEQNPITVEKELTDHQSINVVVTFQRNFNNFLSITLPILMMFALIGTSLLIDSKKRLAERLALYTALFVFALTFSSFNVPSEVVGRNFVETSYLYASIFAGIFAVFSIVNCYFNAKREDTFFNSILKLDLISLILISLLFGLFVSSRHYVIYSGLWEQLFYISFQVIIGLLLWSGFLIKLVREYRTTKQTQTQTKISSYL